MLAHSINKLALAFPLFILIVVSLLMTIIGSLFHYIGLYFVRGANQVNSVINWICEETT